MIILMNLEVMTELKDYIINPLGINYLRILEVISSLICELGLKSNVERK